jgi:class 3 adenylate cyclase
MPGDLAIAFFDVEGYTEFTAEHGDEAGLELAESLLDIASELVEGAGGTVVKRLGDGLMARFDTAQDAVRCATGTQRALQARAALQDDAPVAAAKIGIHVGQVLERDGDIYGNDVNVAARLVDKARGGQVLLTEPAVEALGDGAEVLDLKRIGRLDAKGLREKPRIYLVRGDTGILSGPGPLHLGDHGLLVVLAWDAPGDDMDAFIAATRAAEAALNGVGGRIIFSGVCAEADGPDVLALCTIPDDHALDRLRAAGTAERFAELSAGALEERLVSVYRPMHTFGVLFPEGGAAEQS